MSPPHVALPPTTHRSASAAVASTAVISVALSPRRYFLYAWLVPAGEPTWLADRLRLPAAYPPEAVAGEANLSAERVETVPDAVTGGMQSTPPHLPPSR